MTRLENVDLLRDELKRRQKAKTLPTKLQLVVTRQKEMARTPTYYKNLVRDLLSYEELTELEVVVIQSGLEVKTSGSAKSTEHLEGWAQARLAAYSSETKAKALYKQFGDEGAGEYARPKEGSEGSYPFAIRASDRFFEALMENQALGKYVSIRELVSGVIKIKVVTSMTLFTWPIEDATADALQRKLNAE